MSKEEGSALEPSSELVRWLRMLVLPLWARVGMLVLIVCVILGAASLLAMGVLQADSERTSSAIGLLTVALPVMLLVIALVFGQNSDQRLRELTASVLRHEIPRAIQDNLGGAPGQLLVDVSLRGCCADYVLRLPGAPEAAAQRFSVELNVYKVNICFWLDGLDAAQRLTVSAPALAPLRHVIVGALAEGYRLNEEPARSTIAGHRVGLIFFRSLAEDFLLQAGKRLYFVQDLAFFVRGVVEAGRVASAARALP